MPDTLLEPMDTPAVAHAAASAAVDARPDLALAHAVLAGDAGAFEAIMRRHNRLMFRTARGIVDNDVDAQDVVQEAYLRAFTAMHAYRGDAALGTWLARIAINVALSVMRKKGRLVAFAQDFAPAEDWDNALDTDHPEHAMAERPSDTASPETRAAQAQLRELLQRAIDQLPPIYRSVFMLRAVEELSIEETAHTLQVSADVVKTRYLRARHLLRGLLDADAGHELGALYAFAGERCDAVVAAVLAQLRARGLIRPH